MRVRFFSCLSVLFFLLCFLAACQGQKKVVSPVSPPISVSETPAQFATGLSLDRQGLRTWQELTNSIAKSLAYVQGRPESGVALRRCDETITWHMLTKSLRHLLLILPELDRDPSLLTKEFRWVPIGDGMRYGSYSIEDLRAKGSKLAQQGKGTTRTRLNPFSSLAVDTASIPLGAIVAYRITVSSGGSLQPVRALGFAHDTCRSGKDIEVFCGREQATRRLANAMQGEGSAWILLEK